MKPHLGVIVGLLGMVACQSTIKIAELSGTTDSESSSTTQSGGTTTTGELCSPGDFSILDQCYHQTEIASIDWAFSVVAADFTGSQSIDIVTTCRGLNTPLGICFLSLDGTVIKLDLDWLSAHPEFHAGDFNADGISDVVVSELYHFAVFSVDLNQGVFVPHSSLILDQNVHDPKDAAMFPVRPIDLDQDGRAEIVTGSGFNGIRLWRFNTQNSQWEPAGDRQSLFGCGDLGDARVADLDGDSVPELLALGSHNNCDANLAPGTGWNRVSVFRKNPNAVELSPAGSFAADLPARYLELADINNGDDAPDLFIASKEDMMMFRGHGDGTFDVPVPIHGLARFYGSGPHAGDFNGDGIDELTVNQVDDSYRVLVGLPAPQIIDLPAVNSVKLVTDLNQDGHADIVSNGPGNDYSLVLSLSVP